MLMRCVGLIYQRLVGLWCPAWALLWTQPACMSRSRSYHKSVSGVDGTPSIWIESKAQTGRPVSTFITVNFLAR